MDASKFGNVVFTVWGSRRFEGSLATLYLLGLTLGLSNVYDPLHSYYLEYFKKVALLLYLLEFGHVDQLDHC